MYSFSCFVQDAVLLRHQQRCIHVDGVHDAFPTSPHTTIRSLRACGFGFGDLNGLSFGSRAGFRAQGLGFRAQGGRSPSVVRMTRLVFEGTIYLN